MDNESYMKIRDTIEKSLNDFRLALNWFEPIDISTRSGPDGVRISFDCFECEVKEPTLLEAINSAGLILKNSYFILTTDNQIDSIFLRDNSTVIESGKIIEFEGILDRESYPFEYLDIGRKGPWRVEITDDTTKIALDGEYLYSESYPHDDGFGNIVAKSRVYKFKKFERKKEPTPTTIIYYYKYFDTNTDDYIVAEFPSASDKSAIKHFKFIIETNTDKARWNMTELYSHYFGNYKRILYSCDMIKPDYQKIDEINATLRNMK